MSDTKFTVNEKVVYPSQGVGLITEIFDKNFRGTTMQYYKIYIEVSDMVVLVPVNKADELGIRPIVGAEEAEKALNSLSDDFEPITSDWKMRYQMNLDLLKKGTIADIAAIVRCLYNRSKVKELPILERKLYDQAKKLLEDEISLAMGISAKEVESMIHLKLEPPGSTPKVKHIIDDFNDEDDDLMDDVSSKGKRKGDDDDEDDDDSDDSSDDLDAGDDDFSDDDEE